MKNIWIITILFALAFPLSADDPISWLYILTDNSVEVGDPDTKEIVSTIGLPHTGARHVHPTPGGKFVFVTYGDQGVVTAIDVETHEVAGSTSFSYVPAFVQFSSMGDKAFITNYADNEVRIYDHRRAEFTYIGSLSVGDAGTPVISNRRTTRLYRAGDEELNYIYLKTEETIDVVKVRGGLSAVAMSPDYRSFWTVNDQDGYLTVIDEARARISKQVKVSHSPLLPVFTDTAAALLSRDGRTLNLYSQRNYRLQKTIDLKSKAMGFVVTNDNDVWYRGDAGISVINLDSEELYPAISIRDSLELIYVVVRTGEGFACF